MRPILHSDAGQLSLVNPACRPAPSTLGFPNYRDLVQAFRLRTNSGIIPGDLEAAIAPDRRSQPPAYAVLPRAGAREPEADVRRAGDPAALRRRCDEALQAWGVHYASAAQNAGALSGGNAQKVILAREIDEDARLIVAAQPARGLDIGATAFVWSALRQAAGRGCGVSLISSDLDELFDVSHRLVVMLSGRIVAEFVPPYDIAAVGRAMTGAVE